MHISISTFVTCSYCLTFGLTLKQTALYLFELAYRVTYASCRSTYWFWCSCLHDVGMCSCVPVTSSVNSLWRHHIHKSQLNLKIIFCFLLLLNHLLKMMCNCFVKFKRLWRQLLAQYICCVCHRWFQTSDDLVLTLIIR